jgi:hypothetical protein
MLGSPHPFRVPCRKPFRFPRALPWADQPGTCGAKTGPRLRPAALTARLCSMAVRAAWWHCSAASDEQCSCQRSCSFERSAEIRFRKRECSEPLSDVLSVTSHCDSGRALLRRKPFKPWHRTRVASGCRSCCPMPNYLATSQFRPSGGNGAFRTTETRSRIAGLRSAATWAVGSRPGWGFA